jgi:methylase of polypeptide subunit release factors
VSGAQGLDVISRIATNAKPWLAPRAVMLVEVSEFHAARAASLFAGFDVEVRTDMFGKDRFVVAHSRVE